ncbi:MAG TPA: UPF0182 family protein [Gemmatimonadaceae bacterium]|nr:UPF0182 family protein [Gemmatimonadaceae bacterium]
MSTRRRLLAGLVAGAAVLLVGRVAAVIYAEYAWYAALGATPLWREKIYDSSVIHTTSAIFGGLFALVNLFAVRRSIVSLAFPRRLGNVEFGEAVPQKQLDRMALVLSIVVAAVMTIAVPRWESLALLRTGARFGETDPFFNMDLSFFTSWLPLESEVYRWCLALLVVVGAMVVGLYALTPSLRWHHGSFRVSVRVRRHLSVLSALFLLTMAWSYRLDGYELLMHGSGPDGMFSYVDHQWLIPAYLSLSVGTVAAAVLVLVSGWMGQVKAGFFTVSAVLIFSVALDLILPSVVRQVGMATGQTARDTPYASTRAVFTRRAYGLPRDEAVVIPKEESRFASFVDSARVARVMTIAKDSSVVYPGASGSAIVKRGPSVAAPMLGDGLKRLGNAWAEQRLDLVWSSLPANTKLVRHRDVRERLGALVPLFVQGSDVVPAYLGDSLTWVVELYSASDTYPLSKHYVLAGADRSYFHHSATALLNAASGRVVIVPIPGADPIATAWRLRFPQLIRPGAPDLLDALTSSPRPSLPDSQPAEFPPGSDAAFKAAVTRLYARMRGALSAGDLKAFGAAYDSLGAIVEKH